MNVLIKIPDSIVEKLKDEKDLSNKQVSCLFKGYIDSCLGVGSHFAYDEFLAWVEDEGEDCLSDFEAK